MKDIHLTGLDGQVLAEKWREGTWTYLGIATAGFPNFFFLYGPQGPTAFSNGPSCVEPQGDWVVNVLKSMREKGLTRIDPKEEAEKEWKATVRQLHARSLRDKVDGWYNGAVSLTVFDFMAKLISVLEHSRKTKGTFELCWWDSTVYQDDHGMLGEQLRRIRRLIGGGKETYI